MSKQKIEQGRNWYVLHTYPGEEEAVMRNLKQRIESLGMDDKIFKEKCYWYLGNALLLQENPEKALEMFTKVIELEGEFEWEASEILQKIKRMKKIG